MSRSKCSSGVQSFISRSDELMHRRWLKPLPNRQDRLINLPAFSAAEIRFPVANRNVSRLFEEAFVFPLEARKASAAVDEMLAAAGPGRMGL